MSGVPRLLLIGAGNMGGAMLRRWIDTGYPADRITVVSPSLRSMPPGVTVVADIPYDPNDDDPGYDVIMLGVKPQQLSQLRNSDLNAFAPKVLISILAGVEEETLRGLCNPDAVVRAMPNLPVALGKGVVTLYSSSSDSEARALVTLLMAPLGLVEWTDSEALYSTLGTLDGCGPAFLFRFIDALAKAGEALGIAPDQAARLALATVEGAAAMAAASDATPATLADRVASPGGSTRQGLNVLDRDDALVKVMTETLAAAERRGREMAEEAKR